MSAANDASDALGYCLIEVIVYMFLLSASDLSKIGRQAMPIYARFYQFLRLIPVYFVLLQQ